MGEWTLVTAIYLATEWGRWISSDYGSLNPVHYIRRSLWIGGSVGCRDGLASACDGMASRRLCFPGLPWSVYSWTVWSLRKKYYPVTVHEGREGEWIYTSTLSLTSALDGVGGQRHAPAALPPGKTRYQLYRRLGGPQGRSGLVRKISPPAGIRSPDRPASSESLYRLRYRGPFWVRVPKRNEK